MIQLRRNDFELQNMERWWLKVPEWVCTMALNAEINDGSKRQN